MTSPLRRILHGGILLIVVCGVAICGYRYLGDYDWIGALWMVVVTISTVGYSEHSALPPRLQLLTAGVIIIGISASAYTFSGLIQLMLEGEIDRILGVRRMTRDVKRMRDHIIVCGYGRMGQRLSHELASLGRSVVVLEIDAAAAAAAHANDIVC